MSNTHHEIIFSPFNANILDYLDNENLSTPDGTPVSIKMVVTTFYITIGSQVHAIPDNLAASYLLNINQVGIQSRSI